MASLRNTLLLLSIFLTSACSTVLEGTTQKITVNSEPQGAQCLFRQADTIVGHVTTPGSATVDKSKNDVVILCSKPGYETASVDNRSDLSIASLGNAAFYQLSFVGNAVDAMTGANNKYDSEVMVKLVPATEPAAFPIPPGMQPVKQLPAEAVNAMAIIPPGGWQATAAPVTPVSATTIATDDPAINAARIFGKAARTTLSEARQQQQVAYLTYDQQVAQMPNRPPFEVTQ